MGLLIPFHVVHAKFLAATCMHSQINERESPSCHQLIEINSTPLRVCPFPENKRGINSSSRQGFPVIVNVKLSLMQPRLIHFAALRALKRDWNELLLIRLLEVFVLWGHDLFRTWHLDCHYFLPVALRPYVHRLGSFVPRNAIWLRMRKSLCQIREEGPCCYSGDK